MAKRHNLYDPIIKNTGELFESIEDNELASKLSEYLIRNIGNDDYQWWETSDYFQHYLVTKGSKDFLINYRKGTFYYGHGAAIVPGRKQPDNEPINIDVSFPGELSKHDSPSECKKSFWNGEHAVYEQYFPSQQTIIARVYTAKTVNEYSKSCGYTDVWKNKVVPKKLWITDIPKMMETGVYADKTIVAEEITSGKFIVYDANDKSSWFYIEGSSLYDAYYGYMVEQDYFTEDGQKTGRKARISG